MGQSSNTLNEIIGFVAAVCSLWESETKAAGLLQGRNHHDENVDMKYEQR